MAKKKEEKETKEVEQENKWFYQGEEGLKIKKQQDAMVKLRKEKLVSRFRLGANESAKIVFVDSEGFYCYEHNIAVGGKYGNYITCTQDFTGNCPLCEKKLVPTYTAYYTIIDTREFVKKDGTKVKNRKVLFPAKKTMIFLVDELRRKNNGNLVGIVAEVKRYSEKGTNCGEYIEKIKKVDIKKVFGEDATKPIDYLKVLAPPTKEELIALGFGIPIIVGSEEDIVEDLEGLEDILGE